MANRLRELDIEEVSLVDVPAIRRKFLITKAGTENPVDKAATFNQLIVARNIDEDMWDAFYALKQAVYDSLAEPNAGELIQNNIGQFTAYLINLLGSTAAINKAKETYKPEEPVVELGKAGAKISRPRMEALTGMREMMAQMLQGMDDLLKDVTPADPEPDEPNVVKTDPVPAPGPEPAVSAGVDDLKKNIEDLATMLKTSVTPQAFSQMVAQHLGQQ